MQLSKQADSTSSLNVHHILQYVHDQVSQEIWQKALALYRFGQISEPILDDDLITAEIEDRKAPRGRWQIRFKLQGRGQAIRWYECNCSYARKTGGLCEHLLATFLMICREKPEYFSGLNPRAPFAMGRIGGSGKRLNSRNSSSTPSLDYVFDILSLASLDKIELYGHGGFSRVHFELRQSYKDAIELSVDETSLLLNHPHLKKLCQSHLGHVVFAPYPGHMGWKVAKSDDREVWHIHKKILFWIPATDTKELTRIRGYIGSQSRDSDEHRVLIEEEKEGVYLWKKKHYATNGQLIVDKPGDTPSPSDQEDQESETKVLFSVSRESVSSGLGHQHLFIQGFGFMNLELDSPKSVWHKSPHTLIYRGKEIDKLIATEFQALRSLPTLIDKTWLKDSICEVEISRIELYDFDDPQFILDPKYEVNGELFSVSKIIRLAKDRNRQFVSVDQKWIKVPDVLIDLDFQLDPMQDAMRLDTISLLRWRSLFDRLDDLWCGREDLLLDLKKHMTFHDTTNDDLDFNHTNLVLRDYQIEGARWLWWLYKNRLHGLFADDMGLGKTHQTMALLSLIFKQKSCGQPLSNVPEHKALHTPHSSLRFLVICPTTVVGHWQEKMTDFTPVLKPLRYHGLARELVDGYITLITSYGVLLRDIEDLSKITWDVVVCDEAHVIKNPKTSIYWACKRLQAKMRLCLSGTPIENRIYELKTLFDFLLPGYLGNQNFFKKYYDINSLTSPSVRTKKLHDDDEEEDNKEPISTDNNQPQDQPDSLLTPSIKERENRLKRLIEPLKMRRTKDQVLHDLPEKVEDIRHCNLTHRQATLYKETIKSRTDNLIHDLHNTDKPLPYLHIFALLQRLKQICNHPSLITGKPWREESSEKFELLKELIAESLASSHKVVIFSQYVKMIDIIIDYLKEENISHVSLVGHSKNREQIVAKFQNDPSVSVFVGSLLAGGVGIDLTAASVVIHYDRWWNASKENQATDRVHRIGQKNSLLVLKLVTLGTIEEKIDKMIQKKQKLFDIFLAKNPAHFKQFTREELIDLVSSDLTQN
ncbi:MAG: DEAD/DEAH box helicase [Proteobacteria bacterium]|nr:DEAD/DEAH box helicase [Pseudomonadota bacterium]